jgi:hypothetical protein
MAIFPLSTTVLRELSPAHINADLLRLTRTVSARVFTGLTRLPPYRHDLVTPSESSHTELCFELDPKTRKQFPYLRNPIANRVPFLAETPMNSASNARPIPA